MKSAAVVIIGNEILSGRTQDTNTKFIAIELGKIGINLSEVSIILDCEDDIIAKVKNLSQKYDYVFTTGGIGPTHDDITVEAIAKCFDIELELNTEALNLLQNYYKDKKITINDAGRKMAYIPKDAELIYNPISAAPGFKVKNVYVMAGVPNIMQKMFENIIPYLVKSLPVESLSINIKIAEGDIADKLTLIQNKYPQVAIGSYPYEIKLENSNQTRPATDVILRSNNKQLLNEAHLALKNLIAGD